MNCQKKKACKTQCICIKIQCANQVSGTMHVKSFGKTNISTSAHNAPLHGFFLQCAACAGCPLYRQFVGNTIRKAIRNAKTTNPSECRQRRHFVVFIISDCFSYDFACRHAVFLVNLGPWALERSDLTQSGGSGGAAAPRWLRKLALSFAGGCIQERNNGGKAKGGKVI